jgi:hypothetical protein
VTSTTRSRIVVDEASASSDSLDDRQRRTLVVGVSLADSVCTGHAEGDEEA